MWKKSGEKVTENALFLPMFGSSEVSQFSSLTGYPNTCLKTGSIKKIPVLVVIGAPIRDGYILVLLCLFL